MSTTWILPDGSVPAPAPAAPPVHLIQARYEAAHPEYRNLWPMADGLSADALADPGTRRALRERTRNQLENDSLAEGLVDTLANDTISVGPRLQVLTEDDQANRAIGDSFMVWARKAKLAKKLRIMRRARSVDGEAFGIMGTNPTLRHAVKLDLKLIECDRVTSPHLFSDPDIIDGIEFDEWGNPAWYHVLKDHPGDAHRRHTTAEYDRIPAESVVHWFKPKRPEQHRGIPELAPALLQFAHLKRFVLATVAAAEQAANYAVVIKTDTPPNGEAAAVKPMVEIALGRNSALSLPAGWDISQVKSQHPTTTMDMFRREMVSNIARCQNMPLNIALLNSSGFNFASGRLDYLIYHTSLRIDREDAEIEILDRLLEAWLAEAVLVSHFLPIKLRTRLAQGEELPHQWRWPGHQHAVDPQGEAAGQTERMANGTSNLQREHALLGLDWQEEREQRYVEKAFDVEMEKKYGVKLDAGDAAPKPGESAESDPAANPADPAPDDDADPDAGSAGPKPGKPGKPAKLSAEGGGGMYLIGDKTLARDLIRHVVDKQMSPDSAKALMVEMIGLTPDQAERILSASVTFDRPEQPAEVDDAT